MDKLYEPLNQNSATDITNEEWYKSAEAIFNARMADYRSYGQPGGYQSYLLEARKYQSNLDPFQTLGYLNSQRAIDSNWEYAQNIGKSIYNGSMGVVRDMLNSIRTARDYNIAMLNEQAKAQGIERNPDQDFINALDNATKTEALQPYEVKQSASSLGQLGLDVAEGAGQLVGQMAVSIPAEAVAPGIGGLAMMVAQITGGGYERLKSQGVDTKRAAEAAFANAVVQAPFERLALTKLMKRIPANSVLKKKLQMVMEKFLTEGATEAIQQLPEEWSELWALNPDKSWKELQQMAAKKFPDTLQNALYAGLIGGILGAGAGGVHIAIDRNLNMALRKELHDESVASIENRINNIKQSGISPDYAAETINANLNNATVLIDGGTLNAYAQRVGEEKAAEKLGVTVDIIREADEKGDTVEVNQGNFEALAASDDSFYQEVKDDISFDAQDMSNRKYETIQANIERYSKLGEKQRTELKTEVDKIAKTLEETGASKSVVSGWKAFYTSAATAARPDNPAQWVRDNPLRFERGLQQEASVLRTPQLYQSMWDVSKAGVKTLGEFYKKILEVREREGLINSVKLISDKGIIYPENQVVHAVDTHDLTEEQLEDIDKNIDKLTNLHHSAWIGKDGGEYTGKFNGSSVIGRLDGDLGSYYLTMEVDKNNNIWFKTASLESSAEAVDKRIEDMHAAVLSLSEDSAVPDGQLHSSIKNIHDYFEKVNNQSNTEQQLSQETLQNAADAVNTVELNVVSARDPEAQAYMKEQMLKRGMLEEDADGLLALLNGITDDVEKLAKKYPAMLAWQQKGMDRVADEISGLLVPKLSAFKKNGEYKINIDLGTLCMKREAADVLNQILISEGLGQQLGPSQLEALKDLLKSYKYLTACDVCFVEAKRVRMLADANKTSYDWKSTLLAAGITDDQALGKERVFTEEQENRLARMADPKTYREAFEEYMPQDRRRTKTNGDKGADLDTGTTPDKMLKIAKLFTEDPSLAGELDPTTLITTAGTDYLARTYGGHTNIMPTLSGMYGSATSKPLEGFTLYDALSWRKSFDNAALDKNMDDVYAIGGGRAQSFTDFNPILFLDYVQMIADYEARNLPMHVYTKVPSFVKLFGETGIMINMSFVPEIVDGVDEAHAGLKWNEETKEWEYAWHEDSFPIDLAYELRQRKEYGGRVGIIAVGVSKEHIKKLMADPRIDMVIPYHASGMPHSVKLKTGLEIATDYTDVQTAKIPATAKEKIEKETGLAAEEYLNYSRILREPEFKNPHDAAKEYLRRCDKYGCTPVFEEFRNEDGYFKVLEDFRGLDDAGNGVAQGPVRLKLPDNWKEELDEALGDRGKQKAMLEDLKTNEEILSKARAILKAQRLDGEIREVMLKRLRSALGQQKMTQDEKNALRAKYPKTWRKQRTSNVQSLKKSEFLDKLEAAYAKDMTAEEAKARVEVFRMNNGIVYGFAQNGQIFLNENAFNANTPAHEFTHIWAKVAQEKNPKLWAEGVNLLKSDAKEMWETVEKDPLYESIRGDENAIASEVLSRLVGEQNEEFVRELMDPTQKMPKGKGLTKRIQEWLLKIFNDVRSLFDSVDDRPLTFDEFRRMPLKTLWDVNANKQFRRNSVKYLQELQEQGNIQADAIEMQAAYHGTPSRFDRFDTEHIGEGEGAQVHGWGLYFAQDKDVAEGYRRRLTSTDYKVSFDGKIPKSKQKVADNALWGIQMEVNRGSSLDEAVQKRLDLYRQNLKFYEENPKQATKKEIKNAQDVVDFITKNKDAFKSEAQGQVFEADIPENDVLLDEQKTFKEQDKNVQKLLAQTIKSLTEDQKAKFVRRIMGEEFDKPGETLENAQREYVAAENTVLNLQRLSMWKSVPAPAKDRIKRELKDSGYSDDQVNQLIKDPGRIDAEVEKFRSEHNTDELQNRYNAEAEADKKAKAKRVANIVDNISDALQDESGQWIYGILSDVLGSPKDASLKLNENGIKGITYDGYSDGRSFVVFDDKAIDILNKYYQRQQEASQVKGSFDPFTDGEAVIKLFEGADASTVIHETGHYYIESMWREIAAGRATEQQKADFEKLMKYCGITTEQWARMDTEGRRAAHERLAEAIETYVMEDKAPTRELRPVFKRFAKWLKAVYSAISRNQNAVPLTDEVREVFDRMLASEEDVEQMRRVEGYFEKLPSVITDNLSDATKKRIEDYILKAQDKAVEILTKERLANFSEDRKREIENYRNIISDEVRQEVANRPLYVAARQVQELLGGEKPASAKQYANLYLEEKLSDENEVKWEIVAEQNNMSPMELAQKLVEEPSETEAYKAAMNDAVRKEYPDYYTEREQAEAATREAMYNDESGILLGVEQTLIEDFAARAAAQQRSAEAARKLAMAKRQQAKVAAQKELSNMKVKDAIRVDKYIAAERRCAVKSAEAMAKKDYETARKYKDMQAFNHAMVIESANMRKRVEQYQKFLRRMLKSKRETWTNENHFNQAMALFARMGLTRKDYDPTTRTQSLVEYLEEMGDMLYPFNEIPEWLADDTWPITNPKEMSFDDYEKVIDLMRYIKTMAKIEKAADFFNSASTYQEWKDNAIENLNKLATKFAPVLGEKQVATLAERFNAAYQTLDNFLEKMDGWTYGFFSRSFGDAIKHANDNEFTHLEAYQKRKAEIENAWCPTQEALEEAAKNVYYEELGTSASKFVLTKMLMNLGNEGNARKLCSSYPSEALRGSSLWVFPEGQMTKDEAIAQTKENLLEFLGRVLTKEDIAYAQAKVDLAGMYWGEIADLERRTRGFTPKKVEAYPVTMTLANGEQVVFRGGYFPLIRNGEMGSHPVGVMPVSETDAKQGKNVRTMYTDRGHTMSRVEAEYPVDLMDGSEDRAMRDAIHDLCWRETMTDFRRILNDQYMFGLMKSKLGIADMQSFREMLEHAAQPNGGTSMVMGESILAQTAGWLRRKTVNSIVMLNLRINLQNFGNFFLYGNAVEGFGYSDVLAAMSNAFSNGFEGKSFSEMWKFVDEKSAFMRSRSESPDITLAELREEGKLNKYERKATDWGAKAMMYTDGMTARPVWMQAYYKKLNQGSTEQEAIDFADTIVRRTLGSGRVTDVSSLQRGGPIFKLFTAFQGFFNTQFNQWMREYNIDKRLLAEGNTSEAVQRITAFVASKYLAACLFNLVFALESPFEDDDDEYMNYTKELMHYPMSLVGIFGSAANFAMDKALGMKAYSYRMSIIESSLDKVFRASGKLGKMIEGDFESGLEGLSDVAGIYAGVPAQMNRLFWNAYDIFVNGMEPEMRDLATRRPKRERK